MKRDIKTILAAGIGFVAVWFLVEYGTFFSSIDRAISEFVFFANGSAWRLPFEIVGSFGTGSFVLLSALAIAILFFVRGLLSSIVFCATLLLTEAVVVSVKWLVLRPRPFGAFEVLSDPGFPSGHAALSVAFFILCAGFLFPCIKNRTLRALAVALGALSVMFICVSRIVLDVHYVSDVLAGIFLGIALSFLTLVLFKDREVRVRV